MSLMHMPDHSVSFLKSDSKQFSSVKINQFHALRTCPVVAANAQDDFMAKSDFFSFSR